MNVNIFKVKSDKLGGIEFSGECKSSINTGVYYLTKENLESEIATLRAENERLRKRGLSEAMGDMKSVYEKEIQKRDKLLTFAYERFKQDDGSRWVKINLNNELVEQWVKEVEELK